MQPCNCEFEDLLALCGCGNRRIPYRPRDGARISSALRKGGKRLDTRAKGVCEDIVIHHALLYQMLAQMELYRRFPLTPVSDTLIVGFAPRQHFGLDHLPPGESNREHVALCEDVARDTNRSIITAVPVDQNDSLEPILVDAYTNILEQIEKRLYPQADGPGETLVVVCKPGPNRWRDDDGDIGRPLCCFHRHVKGPDNVDIHWAMRTVLLDRSYRNNHDRIFGQRGLELIPPHFLPEDLPVAAIVGFSEHFRLHLSVHQGLGQTPDRDTGLVHLLRRNIKVRNSPDQRRPRSAHTNAGTLD